jgi:iron complex transport system substrate-binding protein
MERGAVLTVFWQISADPFFTVTGDHVISEIVELCGGRNVFADAPGLAPSVTLEAIVATRPEVIIAATRAAADTWQARWKEWDELPAVRAGHLYSIDPDLVSRPGPRLLAGARKVCASLDDARR